MIASWAKWVALFFVMVAGLSAILHYRRRDLLKGQRDIESIRGLSWRRLETLVAEAYRMDGYSVVGNSGPGSDGGVDILARKDGETVLVQCKQWKAQKVGVKTVREMFGLLNSEGANEVHVVTSGSFTQEAKDFAANKPIKLIDGPMLFQMVKKAQSVVSPVNMASDMPAVLCPKCGATMALRTAKRGSHTGERFWGCEKFPECNGIRQLM
jgi:restriction system protein